MKLLKYFISIFLVFHLTCVMFVPNSTSYTGQKLEKYILPYMYHLGLSGAWSFFAPEPFSPPMYLDYVVTIKDREPITGRFPEEKDDFFFRARQNRRVSIARFMMQDTANVEFMFVNYLCKKYPNAVSARVWSVRGLQPDFDSVRNSGKKISKTVDEVTEFSGDFACQEQTDA